MRDQLSRPREELRISTHLRGDMRNRCVYLQLVAILSKGRHMGIKTAIIEVQYKYSKLYALGVKRRHFVITQDEKSVLAENNSKNTYFSLVFALFMSGLLIGGFVEAFILGSEITIAFDIVFWVLHIIIGLIGLRHFLWLVNGRHVLRISECDLTLEKRGTFFTRTKSFDLNLVRNLSIIPGEEEMSLYDKIQNNIRINHQLLIRHTYGQITFQYDGETIKVFSDLTKDEKTKLVELIEKGIENCHQHALAANRPRPVANSR
jgi:hypothetical protein